MSGTSGRAGAVGEPGACGAIRLATVRGEDGRRFGVSRGAASRPGAGSP